MDEHAKTSFSNNILSKQYIFGIVKISIAANILSISSCILASNIYRYPAILLSLYAISVIIIIYKIIYFARRSHNDRILEVNAITIMVVAVAVVVLIFSFFVPYVILGIMLFMFDFMMVVPNSAIESFHFYLFIPVISSCLVVVFAGHMFRSGISKPKVSG